MNRILFILLIFAALFSSCRKDDIVTTTEEDIPTVENKYKIRVIGRIIDQDGKPIQNANILADNQVKESDVNGFFVLENVNVGATNGIFIQAEALGYFEGGVNLISSTLADKQVKIQLIKRVFSSKIDASQGGTVSNNGGASVDFQGGSFLLDGQAFSGEVNVFMHYLDPSEADFMNRVPGSLAAINADGSRSTLKSFGMVVVELESDSGDKLQLDSAKPATLRTEVPSSLISEAPSEIPLWYFDSQKARWIEEGSATLQGNVYVGTVKHFTWWNCDVPCPTVNICLNFIDEDTQEPLEGYNICVNTSNCGSACGTTDANGSLCDIIPRYTEVQIFLFNICGETVYTTTIPPVIDDNTVVNFEVNGTEFSEFTIVGTVMSCDTEEPVPSALVSFEWGNNVVSTIADENGQYEIVQNFCGNPIDGVLYFVGESSGFANSYAITIDESLSAEYNPQLCDEANHFTFNGEILSFDCKAIVHPNETVIYYDQTSGNLLGFYGNFIGTFDGTYYENSTITDSGSTTVVVTGFGQVGENIIGQFTTSTGSTGSFSAKRIK
ncbi:MAG: carboxypeptidase regulatory-like domain-containing protein [Lewinellaceae bacterium]|nr:carboxypeptidase regulatory-like domain-containing protein [Lewinellaceae bacterium]